MSARALTEAQARALTILAAPERAERGVEIGAVTHHGHGHRHRDTSPPQIASATARWLVKAGYAERVGPARTAQGYDWQTWAVREDGEHVRLTTAGRELARVSAGHPDEAASR